ncbi:hypothetical protein FOZ61_010717 [Perkinsus olseni]|uniref:Peptidase M50 domain-containing protein n=1 Tax=Perkinsus olseni TaxID=32597 RepID=A0A7J6MWB0_PEROL|nr:hypothetical protein FOZ61_010717 [Perkinsus olseni]KAF4675898.1 hypothetical protein FOL46_009112 [Perkinsus olseni]
MSNLGFGSQGLSQSSDSNSFYAGKILGTPIRVNYWLVGLFVYQILQALGSNQPGLYALLSAVGFQAILQLTVLCHEFGHGSMARYLGGSISYILLWPFGGICFSSYPRQGSVKENLLKDLEVVAAGPFTHLFQAPFWCLLLSGASALLLPEQLAAFMPNVWAFLNPLGHASVPINFALMSSASILVLELCAMGIRINVMLFLFNLLFPMYPMDAAKILVCVLQLGCCCPVRRTARILIWVSGIAAVLFILNGLLGGQGGIFAGVGILMGGMCLVEVYKIHTLMEQRQLHTHPLFENARSWGRQERDQYGIVNRMNVAFRDDDDDIENAHRPTAPASFQGGRGQTGTAAAPTAPPAVPVAESQPQQAPTAPRDNAAFLDRLEAHRQQKSKTVRQLEEERLQREREQRGDDTS